MTLLSLLPEALRPSDDHRRCSDCAWWHRAKLERAIGECGKHRQQSVKDGRLARGPSLRLLVTTPWNYICPFYEAKFGKVAAE